ncbi:tRNA lysidine(34) synthetase TilS [Arenibacterium sp. CAU 1754]
MNEQDAHILSTVRAQFHASPPERIGVAVSGGGDSIALLHVLHQLFDPQTTQLFAATVDHGLRPESADEAAQVRDISESLGVTHSILRWRNWDGTGNLQDQARRARYELLSDWCKSCGISVLALGHTADDQAETVLMRLARSAGVDGLAGIPFKRTMNGITVIRPMLYLTREELRGFLRRHDIPWLEDPSNQDIRFDRVKARQALECLDDLGVTVTGLAAVAQNLAQAREALDWYSFLAARDIAEIVGGDVVLDLRQFRTLPDEIARRLLVRAITWVSGSLYPPRRAPLMDVMELVRRGPVRSATLGGCRVLRHGRKIWICREYNAVRNEIVPVSDIWDKRWHLTAEDMSADYEVRPLGRRGLAFCENWRETGRPHAAIMASPSVWLGDELIAAPMAGEPGEWHAELAGGEESFFAALLSH